MLTKTQMQQIQDLKLMGYTKTDIIRYYEARGEKPPSRPTISKYYDMDVVPDDPGAKLAKLKTFDSEPFRSTILRILETNSGKSFCMSSVYDVLEEKFIENGTYDKLPGNEQTLRNYIHYLEDSGQVNREPASRHSHRQSRSTLSACCCVTAAFYASMHRTINTTLRKPARQSIGASVSLEAGRKSLSLTRMPCLSQVKPMARSLRPELLRTSVRNRISAFGCAIRLTRKARDRLRTPLDS